MSWYSAVRLLALTLLLTGCMQSQPVAPTTLPAATVALLAHPTVQVTVQPMRASATALPTPSLAAAAPTVRPTVHPTVVSSPRPARTSAPAPPTLLPATAAPTVQAAALPNFSHIFIIVLENKEFSSVIGSDSAPYLNHLAATYGLATNYYAIRHPSLPNYLALTGGSTFGVQSDCEDCFVRDISIVDGLEDAGKTWKAYMEDMPRPCFVGSSGEYAQKHNPFIYYDNIRGDPARCRKIVPFTQFQADLDANLLPDYIWITPNLCNDTHDCSKRTGDNWLRTWVAKILASPAWRNDGLLFITYDEGTSDRGCCKVAAGGQIATLVISPLGKAAYTSSVPYDHYSLLRTIEAAWGLPLLEGASCDCAPPMSDFFR